MITAWQARQNTDNISFKEIVEAQNHVESVIKDATEGRDHNQSIYEVIILWLRGHGYYVER